MSVSLREALSYAPVELSFGTSGLRGLVRDITNLEAFVGTQGFLACLRERGEIRTGDTIYLAGDLRPSTDGLVEGSGEILQAVICAVRSAGFSARYLGKIPSPALMSYAMRRNCASVMITGSHIPFDRNGIKFNRPGGELLKSDEKPVLLAIGAARLREYQTPESESRFDAQGMLKPQHREPIPPALPEAAREYVDRYLLAFPKEALRGTRIAVWQHSAVGRDIVTQIISGLGADVVAFGRTDSFVPVDTEAVNKEMLTAIRDSLPREVDAVVSTDGDGDRPLVLGKTDGGLRFFPGDLLGLVTAEYVGAKTVTVPISANDAVDAFCKAKGMARIKTRIGSPYVIAAMREVGWEANGGFLTAKPIVIAGGGTLAPLPTRDAMLPILSVLCASLGKGQSLAAVFDRLPKRFGKSTLLRDFPRERSESIIQALSPKDTSLQEAVFETSRVLVSRDGEAQACSYETPEGRELQSIRAAIERSFSAEEGFGKVAWVNWLDGARIGFSNADVAHIRPSGNAPELRLYAYADSQERADRIAELATRAGGILWGMDREAVREQAIGLFCRRPGVLRLRGAIQGYDWGGHRFIPQLIGEDNAAEKPYAELWIGAHPRAPSVAHVRHDDECVADVPLDELISRDPQRLLGAYVGQAFGGKLPYLFKVLDARTMLSIQAHPSKAQAETGFARENATGIPLSAQHRNYVDENHKPEVHIALTEFWMLHGFRPLEEIAGVLGPRGSVVELVGLAPGFEERLKAVGQDREGRRLLLKELYGILMTMPQERVDSVLRPLLGRLEKARRLDRDSPDYWAREAGRLFTRDGRCDRGIFSIYLLNLLHLRPGQGTFQPSGTLHAYLHGVNVELMANSDNVLRGGLTSKRVDTSELLATLSFDSGRPSVLSGERISETVMAYGTLAREFLLERIEVTRRRRHDTDSQHSADCLLVVEGRGTLVSGGREMPASRGDIFFAPAGLEYGLQTKEKKMVAFRARVPLSTETC